MSSDYPPGKHILLDFWGCRGLSDIEMIEKVMLEAARACGAKVLEIKLHSFGEESGITGVALLAESHISIHTWPEISYTALDVFMCGTCNPEKSIDIFKSYFLPSKAQVREYVRGKP